MGAQNRYPAGHVVFSNIFWMERFKGAYRTSEDKAMTTFWNRGVDTDRRTGGMLATVSPKGEWHAWWDAADAYPGYGFGRTSKEACDDLQANTEEWIKEGKPAL